MKKSLSIILTVIIALSAFFVTAYAADTKTDAMIDEILSTKSLSIKFDDESLSSYSIPFTDVVASAKIYDNADGTKDIKVAATAKLWFFNVKLLLTDGEIYAYLPLISFCVTDMLGGGLDLSVYAEEIADMFGVLESDIFDCLKLKSSGEKDTDKYGKVYVEEFVPDVRKIIDLAVKEGLIEIPVDSSLATMNEAEMLAYLESQGQHGKNVLRMLDSNATFYYSGDNLVSFDIILYDLIDDSAELNSNDLLPVKAEYITSGVEDSAFDKPVALFDLTSLMTAVLGALFG